MNVKKLPKQMVVLIFFKSSTHSSTKLSLAYILNYSFHRLQPEVSRAHKIHSS